MTFFAATYLATSAFAYLCLIAWHHGSRADVPGHDTARGKPSRDSGGVCTTAGVAARMPRLRPSSPTRNATDSRYPATCCPWRPYKQGA